MVHRVQESWMEAARTLHQKHTQYILCQIVMSCLKRKRHHIMFGKLQYSPYKWFGCPWDTSQSITIYIYELMIPCSKSASPISLTGIWWTTFRFFGVLLHNSILDIRHSNYSLFPIEIIPLSPGMEILKVYVFFCIFTLADIQFFWCTDLAETCFSTLPRKRPLACQLRPSYRDTNESRESRW